MTLLIDTDTVSDDAVRTHNGVVWGAISDGRPYRVKIGHNRTSEHEIQPTSL